MNRSDNVFNAAPLGSGGVTGYVFIQAKLVCRSIVSGTLRAGRKLASVSNPAMSFSAKLRKGGYLKSSIQATATLSARLAGYLAVGLSASVQARASTAAQLTRLRRVWMAASSQAAAVVSGSLKRCRKINLGSSLDASATTSATLSRITRKFMAGTTDATATVLGKFYRGTMLKSVTEAGATVSGLLNESSRSRASLERTGFVEPDGRSVIVPKGS